MTPTPRRRLASGAFAALAATLALVAAVSCAKQPVATFEVVTGPPPRIESVSHGADRKSVV